MSRVTLGISLALVLWCLTPCFTLAQSQGYGEPEASAPGDRGGYEGGYGGEGGYGERGASAPGEYGGEFRGGEYEQAGEEPTGRGPESWSGRGTKDIEAALDSKLKSPLEYQEQPLNEVIAVLQEEYNIPILFDNAALEEVAISPDTQVTVNLRNITLRSALRLILRQPGLEDLTFVVSDEVLLITTEEKANETLEVKVYRVDDLVTTSKSEFYDSLVETITRCVAYHTWMANDKGEGEIQLMHPGMLIVTNTREVQDQVGDLLQKLRTTRQEIEQHSGGVMMGGEMGLGGP